MRKRYRAYDLNIDSELALPELPAAAGFSRAPADVTIQLRPASTAELQGMTEYAPELRMGPGKIWIQVPQVGRFLAVEGREIVIDPDAGADERTVRVYLLGSVLGGLLGQRGNLVLHGNVIRIGNSAMVCLGRSGAGKSTLAAAFLKRGHAVVADDVAAINGDGFVLPGIARIKLWQNSARFLQIETAGMERIQDDIDKFNIPLSDDSLREAIAVKWIFALEIGNRPDVELVPLDGFQKVPPLVGHAYRPEFTFGAEMQALHFDRCSRLARKVRVATVRRPPDISKLDDIVDTLISQMTSER